MSTEETARRVRPKPLVLSNNAGPPPLRGTRRSDTAASWATTREAEQDTTSLDDEQLADYLDGLPDDVFDAMLHELDDAGQAGTPAPDEKPRTVRAVRKRKRTKNPRRKTCMQGHKFTPENTYTGPNGKRQCRTCARIRDRARKGYQNKPPSKDRTHCPQGHEYTPENTYVDPRGFRHCRTCKRERDHRTRSALSLEIVDSKYLITRGDDHILLNRREVGQLTALISRTRKARKKART